MRIDGDALYQHLYTAGNSPEYAEEGTEICIECPLCQDDRPRLYISAETGAWTCFHCGEQGGLHRFFLTVCELDTNEAVDLTRKIRLRDDQPDTVDYFARGRDTPELEAVDIKLPVTMQVVSHDSPELYLNYLAKRHVSPELAATRGIGYCESGRYSHRVIIPVESDGFLFTFIARTVLTQCPSCTKRLNDCVCRPYRFPKVLTPKGGKPRLSLYNLDAVQKSHSRRVVVMEGVFDVLRKPHEAVAILGSTASPTQMTLLAGLARERDLIICLDGDQAGYRGALKLAEACASELLKVRVVLLTMGTDPSILEEQELEDYLRDARQYIV